MSITVLNLHSRRTRSDGLKLSKTFIEILFDIVYMV